MNVRPNHKTHLKFRYWNPLVHIMSYPSLVELMHCDPKYIMQSTGKTDTTKNRHLIYDGDILVPQNSNDIEWNQGKEERCLITYNVGLTRFVVYFFTIFGGEGWCGEIISQQLCNLIEKKWFVAGNIYENLELLLPDKKDVPDDIEWLSREEILKGFGF